MYAELYNLKRSYPFALAQVRVQFVRKSPIISLWLLRTGICLLVMALAVNFASKWSPYLWKENCTFQPGSKMRTDWLKIEWTGIPFFKSLIWRWGPSGIGSRILFSHVSKIESLCPLHRLVWRKINIKDRKSHCFLAFTIIFRIQEV